MTHAVWVWGEILCDLFPPAPGVALTATDVLVPHAGGAPANVAFQLARLGVSVGMLSKVGNDPLGARALSTLATAGVDVSEVGRHPTRKTGLTLVQVDADGERHFTPWRERSADQALSPADVPASFVGARVLHTGTVTLRAKSGREATLTAVDRARRDGVLVSLDVNLRFGMFPSRRELLRLARDAVERADVVKATRDEAAALVDEGDVDALIDRLHDAGPALVLLTLDEDGAVLSTKGGARVAVEAPVVSVVDATGAGDAFMGAALARLLGVFEGERQALASLDDAALLAIGEGACFAGAQAVTVLGATTGMPAHLP